MNGNNNASCAIIKKDIFGFKTLSISSEILLVNDKRKADFLFSTYDDSGNRKWIGVSCMITASNKC